VVFDEKYITPLKRDGKPIKKGAIKLTGRGGDTKHNIDRFIEKVTNRTQANPLSPQERITDNGVGFTLQNFQGDLLLTGLRSFNKGSGRASKELKRIIKDADDTGVTLRLQAIPIGDDGLNQKQLVKWYRRHGFKGEPEEMVRPPMKQKD
jgi:hypothetical protein